MTEATVRISFSAGEFLTPGFLGSPGWGSYGVLGARTFDDTTEEEFYLGLAIPTGRKSTSDIDLLVPFYNTTVQTGTNACRWGVEYVTSDVSTDYDSLPSTVVEQNVALDNNQSARVLKEGSLALVYNDADNPLTRKYLFMRIYREAADAGDTMTGDAGVPNVALEYTADDLG